MPWSLIGLDETKVLLSSMLVNGRLPHAIMLTGPLGTGKYSLALEIAQAVNCEQPGNDGSPCGKCLSCQKIVKGNYPDVMVVQPSGKANIITIEDIRNIRQFMAYCPYEAKVKVVIIRQVERFQETGGGALLKTLEEPAPNNLIILTTSSEKAVMTTLVSRCLRLRLPPLGRKFICQVLAEKRSLTGPSAELLAGLSGGALGQALDLDPEEAWRYWEEMDTLMGVQSGAVQIESALEWTSRVNTELDKLKKIKEDPDYDQKNDYLDLLLNVMRLWWRDTAILAATGDPGLMAGPPPSSAQELWSRKVSGKRPDHYDYALSRLSDSLNRSVKADLVFENYWLNVLG